MSWGPIRVERHAAALAVALRAGIEVMTKTRIAIVEDEPAMRDSLSSLFAEASDFELVAALENGTQALQTIDSQPLDVLIVDLGLPDMDGRDVIRHCVLRQPDTDVLVVTVFGGDDQVFGSLAAGATGFLRKDEMPAEMVDCVRTLRAGGSPVSPSIARRLLGFFHSPAESRPLGAKMSTVPSDLLFPAPVRDPVSTTTQAQEALSAREIEILELVGKGLNVADIGALLRISTHTVGTHVKNIYRKLAVHSRTEAVYEARHLGLIRD